MLTEGKVFHFLSPGYNFVLLYKDMFRISHKEYPIAVLKHGITIKSLYFLLENLKNIASFTRFFLEDMYKSPLYGKEWNWRNIKMETRELNIDLRL